MGGHIEVTNLVRDSEVAGSNPARVQNNFFFFFSQDIFFLKASRRRKKLVMDRSLIS